MIKSWGTLTVCSGGGILKAQEVQNIEKRRDVVNVRMTRWVRAYMLFGLR